MRIESSGHSKGNPRLYELVEHAPKTGKSPTVWAWPELMDYLKIAGQPVSGPWPPHQEPRPDPEAESGPVAVADPEARPRPSQAQRPPEAQEVSEAQRVTEAQRLSRSEAPGSDSRSSAPGLPVDALEPDPGPGEQAPAGEA